MLVAVPARIERLVAQAEGRREVHYPSARAQILGHALDGGVIRQGDEDELRLRHVLAEGALHVSQMWKDIADAADLLPNAPCTSASSKIGMAAQQSKDFDAAVSSAVDHRHRNP